MIARYEDREITAIWDNNAKLDRWFAIEVEAMRRTAGNDLAVALFKVGRPEWTFVREQEKKVKHDVMAFLIALDDRLQRAAERGFSFSEGRVAPGPGEKYKNTIAQLRQWLHYGLTSSDLTDTSMMLAVRQTHRLLLSRVRGLRQVLADTRDRAEDTGITIGRTHGQWARPMNPGHPWTVLLTMFNRALGLWSEADLRGKMSGPLGEWRDGEANALYGLGLDAACSTQVVPRDVLVRWARELLAILEVCEAIATKVWFLAQQEVREVQEGRARHQVGSSAMPHKRNPIVSEQIRGLVRLARGYVGMLEPGVVQWGEHDLSHSCVERVALPDLCHVAARVIDKTHELLANLEFLDETLFQSLVGVFPDTHAELAKLQQGGMPYVEAHAKLMGSYRDGKIESTDTEEARA